MATKRIADLDRRIADLVRMREALAVLASRCAEDAHDCAVLEALDEPDEQA